MHSMHNIINVIRPYNTERPTLDIYLYLNTPCVHNELHFVMQETHFMQFAGTLGSIAWCCR